MDFQWSVFTPWMGEILKAILMFDVEGPMETMLDQLRAQLTFQKKQLACIS